MKTRSVLAALCLVSLSISGTAKTYSIDSPDKSINVKVNVDSIITWSVSADGITLLEPSAMAVTIADATSLGINPQVKKQRKTQVNRTLTPVLYKRTEVKDIYNQLVLDFKGDYSLTVRAYDDGVAYRFSTYRTVPLTVKDERIELNFPANFTAYVPYVNDNRSGERYTYSFESYYDHQSLNSMYADSLAITPLLVEAGDYKVAVSDFGARNYPGMFLKKSPVRDNALVAEFATVPLEGELAGYNRLNFIPTKRADYIASDLDGKSELPWRALIIARNDPQLADCDMWVRLSEPSKINTDWIRPGKVAWDWWNNLHLIGVDFKAGRNTPTYKYYIDFAKEYGLEYIIVDDGWSDEDSILKTVGDLNIPELVDYGRQQGVGVILWASWKNIHRELEEAMRHYADMGVAGFKVDFFDADDQNMMKDMEKFAEVAARYNLLLDYHGMKANGLQGPYPNILNFEGVKGLENYRWSSTENDAPGYAVTIPYIRTLVGPMDYTPGAMLNVNKAEHRADGDNPKSEGTRTQQLAMYIVYDAPLQMLADSPTRYRANACCTEFISKIPTVFDESRTLSGQVGEYIVTARRSGDTWYVGAMTNRDGRVIPIDLSFLEPGITYTMTYVQDGLNTDIDATDHKHVTRQVTNGTAITAELHPAGGWAAILTPTR